MLPRHLRLVKSQDFHTIRRWGKRWRDGTLTLNVLKNDCSHNRYGFVVSRKVGKAVTRNRVKRRLRAAIYQWLPYLKTGYDMVIIVHPPVSSVSYSELETTLGHLFNRARLIET
jgi:ribonuclease P protein component